MATRTRTYARAYVGGGLTCTSCHINGARTPEASPWVGIWGLYPEYERRSARVITLADRINECFRRSMNGKPLPLDSAEMRGLLSYMWWLSLGVPKGVPVVGRGFTEIAAPGPADAVTGRALFARRATAPRDRG